MSDQERFEKLVARFDALQDPRTSRAYVRKVLENFLFDKGRAVTMQTLGEFISDHRLDQFVGMREAAE